MKENQVIEWKSRWKDEYLEWICGYANAEGGKLYIGCDDEGNVVGLNNPNKLLDDIPNKVREALGIVVNINLLSKDEKEYIEINVNPYPIGISCKGIYYYRSGSTRQILTGVALETFLLRKRGATWDNLPLPSFTIKDVDEGVVNYFLERAMEKGRIHKNILRESKYSLMEKLYLVSNNYLTNAAMLLFSKNPEKWQSGSYIKIGFFETDANLIYQDEVHGSILEQVDKTMELVYTKYMKARITYCGVQRRERYFVPEEAFREALLNAICHKQYQSGIPIQISVYEDRLHIANCGSLPENWTLDKLMGKHASIPYNPKIAHVLYLAGFIESWGRGIEMIRESCINVDLLEPEYEINPNDIMVTFKAKEVECIKQKQMVQDKDIDNLTEREKAILNLLYENPGYTINQLTEKLGVSRRTVTSRLKGLREKERIERIGTDKKGYWKIK